MTMHNPRHPGEFIWDTCLEPHGVSVRSLAESLGVAASTVRRLVNGQSGVRMSSRFTLAPDNHAGQYARFARRTARWAVCHCQRQHKTNPPLLMIG